MRWSSAWPRPCGNIWTPSGAARREKQSDLGHRHGSVRHRPDRARARAFRRAVCRENPSRVRAGALSSPSQARRLSGETLCRKGGVLQGARHRHPFSRQLAQRLGRECPLGQALAQVLQAARRASRAARHRGRPRVAHRRNRHGLRICRGRGSRSEGPEEKMTLGPVMLDVTGLRVTPEEKEILRHPSVGGVILFARNFESPKQLIALTTGICALRRPELLIAVDHEGGRVQRFQEGFTRIPPMRLLGERWDASAAQARTLAESTGYVVAVELRAHGVDFSFAPVLDVDFGSSSIIGDRAFSDEPEVIAALAGAFVAGSTAGGTASVGKHFPGHGYVKADSHVDVPVDERELGEIEAADLLPYRELIKIGLGGIMPAHVIYPKVDRRPAGFSRVWLKDILRGRLGFDGMIFSDDLSMEGASVAGGVVQRAEAALAAGCDMVLLCNAPQSAPELLDALKGRALDPRRAERMRGRGPLRPLASDTRYASAVASIQGILA